MSANEVLNKDKLSDPQTEELIKKEIVKGESKVISWGSLVQDNRVEKCWQIAEQVVLLAVEWGIDSKEIDKEIISAISQCVGEISKNAVKVKD